MYLNPITWKKLQKGSEEMEAGTTFEEITPKCFLELKE